jgi:hypothetical protein
MKTNKKEISMTDTFWKLTYSDGEIEYTEFAPYSNKSYYEYERLESVGNPVIRFELVRADNSNNDLRFVSVA